MKKFTKLFLSSALVAAMAMSSMVAFADEWSAPPSYDIKGGEIEGTYTTADGKVNITSFVATGDTLDTAKPATFLVVKGDNTVTAAQGNVAGIDQVDTASATLEGAKTGLGNDNKTTPTEGMTPVTYSVYVGYYNSAGGFITRKGTFVVNDGATAHILLGDVTGEGDITMNDALGIAKHNGKVSLITDEDLLTAADVNRDGGITMNDALYVAYNVGHVSKASNYTGKYTDDSDVPALPAE